MNKRQRKKNLYGCKNRENKNILLKLFDDFQDKAKDQNIVKLCELVRSVGRDLKAASERTENGNTVTFTLKTPILATLSDASMQKIAELRAIHMERHPAVILAALADASTQRLMELRAIRAERRDAEILDEINELTEENNA